MMKKIIYRYKVSYWTIISLTLGILNGLMIFWAMYLDQYELAIFNAFASGMNLMIAVWEDKIDQTNYAQ